jgi:multidrug efflux system membrane fusion protein
MLDLAKASLDKASIDYEGALKLREKNLLSVTSVAGSKAALENAKANLKSAELALQRLYMLAPFAGFVEDRPAQIGDLMERSGTCARLVDESIVLATAQAAEREVAPLKIGQPVSVQLTSGGEVNGAISFVGRTADSQTRTYRIEVTLKANGANIRDGGTAQIAVPLEEVMAYRISPAVLALDDAGQVGVRIVNSEKIVEFHPVQVVRESAEGVWVTGLPPEIDLITVGQEFVADGDKVEATPDTLSKEADNLTAKSRKK